MFLEVQLAAASLLDINATLVVELIAFVIMFAVLSRYAYPRVVSAAEGRQRAIAEQLEAAQKERQEAEQKEREADERLREASRQAQEIIDAANRAGEQLRQELRARGEQEAQKMIERALRDIEGERRRALDVARTQVADLVVSAAEKVVGESLDEPRHRRLIERAIQEVGDGRQPG